jgi:hypothetical protein
MADFALWATAAEGALGWEPGDFMKAYSGNRAEATESALDADPVAGAVRELMRDRDEWRGPAGELWEALGELVGEAIRHTNAWPGAPNALSGRLKRLAPALRTIGIEYTELADGKRTKTLTKNKLARDRQHRQDRQPGENSAKVSGNRTDDPADDPGEADDWTVSADDAAAEDSQPENRVQKGNRGTTDDADTTDDDSRPYSTRHGVHHPVFRRDEERKSGSSLKDRTPGRRLTAEEVQKFQRLIREGMSPAIARREVLKEGT